MNEKGRNASNWIYAVLGMLALSAAIYFAFSGDSSPSREAAAAVQEERRPAPTPTPKRAEPAAPTPTAPANAEPRTSPVSSESTASPEKHSLRLTARLLPSGGANPESLRARVGLARISAEDLAEYNAWVEGGREGAGPEDVTDLANVAQWIEAPVRRLEDGGAVLGPIEIAEAPVYRILAWESDMRYYMGKVELPDPAPADGLIDGGELSVHLPTGLVVKLINNPMDLPHYLANLDRVTDDKTAEEASRISPLMQAAAKDLYDAIQGDLMYLMTAGEDVEMIPLYPDPAIRIRLSTLEGLEASAVEVKLEPEKVRTVELDLRELFSGEAMDVYDLHGRLVLGKGGEPIEGVPIERLDAPISSIQTTNRDGEFTFMGLPLNRVTRFRSSIRQPGEGRPITLSMFPFDYDPSLNREDVADGEVTVEIAVPTYRWLVLNLPGDLRQIIEGESQERYPIYMLERYIEQIDTWRAVGAQEFLPEPDAMAVSIVSPGTYRIVAATSPVEVFPSDAADVSESDSEVHVELSLNGAQATRTLRVELSPPSPGRPVFVSGSYGSLPPMMLQTDAGGGVYLDAVNVPSISLEITPPNGQTIEREIALEDVPEDGLIRIDWE